MSFNYNKHKGAAEGNDSFWTSYSDLFLGMSVIFLLLYVTTSLRSGTSGMEQYQQNQQLSRQVEDLKNQLKMYDSVKKDYLNNQASDSEEKMYSELMDKLTLLKEEAKDEKNKLSQAASENEKKERALNQYQQMVRNIINANVLSKTKTKLRDEVITEQDEEIDAQEGEIADLQKDVAQKKKQIADNQQKIADAKEQLEDRLSELKQAYKAKKMSEDAYERKVESVKADNEKRIAQLRASTQVYQNQLNEANKQIAEVQSQLGQVSGELDKTKGTLAKKETENVQLQQQLGQAEEEYNRKVGDLKRGFEDQAQRDRKKFEGELAKERISGAERARREAAFKADADRKQRDLAQKIAALGGELQAKEGQLREKEGVIAAKEGQLRDKEGQLRDKEGQIAAKEGQLRDKEGQLRAKEGQLKDTQGLLAKAREEADARRKVARDIKEGFKASGVDADVNEQTGEVVINFGDVYFDNDSAKLKEKMKETLKRAMPVYSKSLLGNRKVSDKISSIEIIGFASPTFQGKVVDPTAIDQNSRTAIDYNLDLSFKRAKSIFQYVSDETKMQFQHQKDMLPLIKVTGRSFLAEKLPNRRTPSGGGNDFCSTHDCKKAQRVIIRFSFEDKK